MLHNAKTEIWQKAEWSDETGTHACLFNDLQFDPATIPSGMHMYQVRHDDECQGDWCQISSRVIANFWGTILTKEALDFSKYSYNYIRVDDYNYLDEDIVLTDDCEYDVIEKRGDTIRFIGYGYCAGGSVDLDESKIYRFVTFSCEDVEISKISTLPKYSSYVQDISSSAKQYIEDLSEEELSEKYLSFSRSIISAQDINELTTKKDGIYLIANIAKEGEDDV